MKNCIIISIILGLFVTACSTQENQVKIESHENIEDIPIDIDYYESLRSKHIDFLKIFEIEAELNPTNGTSNFRVFRSVHEEALDNDTLRYSTDYSPWNTPNKTLPSDQNFWFEFEIALRDIDSSNIKFNRMDDILWVSIAGVDSSKAMWSKIDLESGKLLWKVPSNEIRFAYLTSKDKIKNNFKYYKMYSPVIKKQVDYVANETDSILGLELYTAIREEIIYYIENKRK